MGPKSPRKRAPETRGRNKARSPQASCPHGGPGLELTANFCAHICARRRTVPLSPYPDCTPSTWCWLRVLCASRSVSPPPSPAAPSPALHPAKEKPTWPRPEFHRGAASPHPDTSGTSHQVILNTGVSVEEMKDLSVRRHPPSSPVASSSSLSTTLAQNLTELSAHRSLKTSFLTNHHVMFGM